MLFLWSKLGLLLAACVAGPQDKVLAVLPSTLATTKKPLTMVHLPTSKDADRIALEKCTAYGEYVYKDSNVSAVRERRCTMLGEALISGGTEARPEEFPHMVALGFSPDDCTYSWRCGGSLISENFVLTAAHCTWEYDLGYVKRVLLGATRLADPAAILRDVAAIFKHPAYAAPAHYDDIALLRLAGELALSPSLRPACIGVEPFLAVPRGDVGPAFDVTGWGINTDGEMLPDLMKVDLYLAPFEMCDEFYKFLTGTPKLVRGIDRESMLCIQNIDPSKDSCQGDSGGPVMSRLTNPSCMFNVAGVTSFGEPSCGGGATSPSLLTYARHYVSWLVSIAWPDLLGACCRRPGVTLFGEPLCGYATSASLLTNVRHYMPWIVSVVWPEDLDRSCGRLDLADLAAFNI